MLTRPPDPGPRPPRCWQSRRRLALLAAILADEDTLSRGLGTPPLPEAHSPVEYRWQNSRCCQPLRGRSTVTSTTSCRTRTTKLSGGQPRQRCPSVPRLVRPLPPPGKNTQVLVRPVLPQPLKQGRVWLPNELRDRHVASHLDRAIRRQLGDPVTQPPKCGVLLTGS